jgi:hypothetical protein
VFGLTQRVGNATPPGVNKVPVDDRLGRWRVWRWLRGGTWRYPPAGFYVERYPVLFMSAGWLRGGNSAATATMRSGPIQGVAESVSVDG